jgi:hypothetical protein
MRRTTNAVTAISAGAAWLVWEGIRLSWTDAANSDCSTASDITSDAVFAAGGLAVAAAVIGLATSLSGVPRWFVVVAAIAAATVGVGNGVEHCAYEPFWLLYVFGALGLTLSTAALGLGLLVTGAMGRWRGLLLVGAALGLMMLGFDRGGAAVFGAAWVAFGLTLLLDRQALQAPAHARRVP